MAVRTIGQRRDGSLLGEDDDGKLHVGAEKFVGVDEAAHEVTASPDGEDVTITESYGGEVLSQSALNRTGFKADVAHRISYELQRGGMSEEKADAIGEERAEEEWQQAIQQSNFQRKLYRDGYDGDGKDIKVEVKRRVIDWTEAA